MISLFDLVAGLLCLTAAFAWLNQTVIRLPNTIGVLVMGLAASVLLLLFELIRPDVELYAELTSALRQVDFYDAVINGMLAFLLFAGALHVDFSRLRNRAAVVGVMATLGVALSTALVGVSFWYAANHVFGVPLSLAWALVFGALISPTDPIAVLGTLKEARVPENLETDMAGESLFNDGVGVVLFTILLAAAMGSGGNIDLQLTMRLLFVEAVGGALLGLAGGYVAYRAMRWIDDYAIEVLISIALVMGTYALAHHLRVSGPIAVVVAGLLIGERGPAYAMSDLTQRYLFGFWTLTDEILNSMLFLLIGLEVLVISFRPEFGVLAAVAVPLTLIARTIAVALPVSLMSIRYKFVKGTIPILVWGGVRGGISIALALSIPDVAAKPVIVTATYVVVLFTLVVQGLTLKSLAPRFCTTDGK